MSYQDKAYNLVKEIDAKAAEVREAVRNAERAPTVRQLDGGLGSVAVSGTGELLEVFLDVEQVRNQTAASLARQVLRGIQQTELDARRAGEATIAEATEEARFW